MLMIQSVTYHRHFPTGHPVQVAYLSVICIICSTLSSSPGMMNFLTEVHKAALKRK